MGSDNKKRPARGGSVVSSDGALVLVGYEEWLDRQALSSASDRSHRDPRRRAVLARRLPARDRPRRVRRRPRPACRRTRDRAHLRSFLESHLAAVGALACATRANARQITSLTIGAVERIGASLASGHRLPPAFVPLLAAHVLARQEQGADGGQPLFLAPDRMHQATARHVNSWLARVGHETGLALRARCRLEPLHDTHTWATFRHLETVQLLAIPQRQAVGDRW